MFNELEQVGLKDPVYHTNAFMLQAVIYNLKVGETIVEKNAASLEKVDVVVNKSLIDSQKSAIGHEKSAIGHEKSAIGHEKSAIGHEKSAIGHEKSAIGHEKSAIGHEKSAIGHETSAIDIIKSAIAQQKYNEPSKANILKVYDVIEKNQIFGTREIAEILDCSPSTARAVMTKLRDMEVVKAVNGKGKGKYVFID